jgi:hypothetical protein
MKARIALNRRTDWKRKPRPGMSASHLDDIRACCCLICGVAGGYKVEAHHLLRTGEHGMGRRSSDKWAVPLCRDLNGGHHLGKNGPHAHGNEDEWFAMHGLDGRAIAKALWAKRGDLEAMQRIAFNQFQKVRTR